MAGSSISLKMWKIKFLHWVLQEMVVQVQLCVKSGNFNFKLSQRIRALFTDFFELKLASGPQSFYRYGPEASFNSKKSGKSARICWLNLKLKLPDFSMYYVPKYKVLLHTLQTCVIVLKLWCSREEIKYL